MQSVLNLDTCENKRQRCGVPLLFCIYASGEIFCRLGFRSGLKCDIAALNSTKKMLEPGYATGAEIGTVATHASSMAIHGIS